MSVIDEVKDRIDAVELIGETVKLRKSGKNFTGFCPFHSNTRTPAFVVFPETNTWRCFGACGEGGDIFSFVMKKEGLDFPEALRSLAEKAGVEVKPRTQAQEAADQALERFREALEAAVVFYRHQLMESKPGASVRDYLHGRGLEPAALEAFEIGYAPDSWDAAKQYLGEKGFSEKELLEAGIVSERESGGSYDRFRNRIMFPIRDHSGRMAGLGARVVDPDDVPKFLNSPQSRLFDKGRILYGLDKARKSLRSAREAVIVEGYLDVVALHQKGHTNVVSPMGTALTEPQLRLLKRYNRRIVLALDPDAAGVQATLRGLTVAREAMDRELDPVFDARGMVRYEGRLDAEMRVVTLPDGEDPDEIVLRDPSAWEGLLEGSQTIVDYVSAVLTEDRDLEDPKVKAEIARQVMPLIEEVLDPVERETYRQRLARRLKVDERALLDTTSGGRRPRRRQRAAPAARPQPAEAPLLPAADAKAERFCMSLLLRNPELLYGIDRVFQELGLPRLSEQDFTGSDQQVIFHTVRRALEQDEVEPSRYWRESLEFPLQDTASKMQDELDQLAEFIGLDLNQPKDIDEITARFLQLRMRSLERNIRQLHFQIQAAQESQVGAGSDQEAMWDLTRQVQRLAPQKSRLEQALLRRQRAPLEDLIGREP